MDLPVDQTFVDVAIDFPHEGSAQVSGDAFGSKTQFGFLGDEPMTNGTLW